MAMFHKTQADSIDEGDVVAYIDDLPFEYTTLEEITEEQESKIDWVKIRNAQITGSLVYFETFDLYTWEVSKFQTAASAKFLILDEW